MIVRVSSARSKFVDGKRLWEIRENQKSPFLVFVAPTRIVHGTYYKWGGGLGEDLPDTDQCYDYARKRSGTVDTSEALTIQKPRGFFFP